MPIEYDKEAVLLEIKAKLIQLDIKLEQQELVSDYVELLVQKRQLTNLYNEIINGF